MQKRRKRRKINKAKVLPVKTTLARARVAKSAASENNTCTCRICNLISAEKATFKREKCPTTLFFFGYKNILYNNIEAEIWEILRIF